jgi:polar amino acid transport system substrate-binding protein
MSRLSCIPVNADGATIVYSHQSKGDHLLIKNSKKIAVATGLAIAALVSTQTAAFAAPNAAAVAKLPASIKKSGFMTFGVDATYRPNEFKDAKGNPIGWEVELVNAVAADLGVKVHYVVATFDAILPAIKGGKYDAGISSFTDTKEREAQVDFANYFTAGIQWASLKGKNVDPNNACGLSVAVQTGSTEVDDLKAKSAVCTKAGKKAITVLSYDAQDAATSAVVLGRAGAFTADSPVAEDAVAQSKGKLVLAGAIYGAAPYGLPVAKGSTLVKAISIALNDVNKSGQYAAILKKWGVQAGAVSSFGVNGAIN